MKIFKIIIFILWGIITFSFLILALIHRQDFLRLKLDCQERFEVCENKVIELFEIRNEYKRNFELIKNDSLNKIDIDSLYNNSNFLNN